MNPQSLQLQISLLDESLTIHGQYIFDAFANPVISTDDSSGRYDAFTTFIEGEDKYTYLLVDEVGYVVHSTGNTTTSVATQDVSCLSSVESLSSIVSSLNSAIVGLTSSSSYELLDCNDEAMIEDSLERVDFQICASGVSGFVVFGGSMLVRVEYLESPFAKISVPTLTSGEDVCKGIS
ncbi:putative membrane protein [Phytophthora megakarya]|uniref:Putative membrane protein n=1 Tax=Phytophthora megakarya TaxID=4795 RepID=A0A225WH99_9STRA|nr:putative membrane protein [Phytophthora megakarya]